MRKLSALWRLAPSDRRLLCEAVLLLVLTYVASRTIRFRTLVSFVRLAPRRGNQSRGVSAFSEVRRVRWAVGLAGRVVPWKTSCLAKAVTAKLMLNRRNTPSTLHLGVCADTNVFGAHAWLLSGETVITGAAGMQAYVPVAAVT